MDSQKSAADQVFESGMGSATDVEIHTANAPDGEPLVVVGIGGRVTVLTLQTATDISQAITKAVAASVIKDPVEPVSAPLIQIAGA